MPLSKSGPILAMSILLLVCALPCTSASLKVARDWSKNPAVVQIDTRADIFAIGDIHGDRDRLIRLLTGAKLVQPGASTGRIAWTGGASVLVVAGDMIDKGPDGPGVLSLLRSLHAEAPRSGGAVVVLMGNHEVDFLRNPETERVREFAQQLKAIGLDPKSVASCAGPLGAFLCGLPFAARVNDSFFSHAGNAAGRSLAQLSADLQSGVTREGFEAPQLTAPDSLLQARLGELGPGGKSWFEGKHSLEDNLTALGVKRIVQGHQHNEVHFPDGETRRLGEVYQWRGELFLIDAGMSRDIDDSAGAALRLRPAGADAICPDGRVTKLWDPARPTAGKGVHCAP
jgi:hypothetical protein